VSGHGSFRLEARGVRKSFGGVEVLHGVDLDAVGGSVLALLGENGAGKSTLVKIIAGDYQPDAGSLTIAGEEVSSLDPIAARGSGSG
jgi:ABC-type sugar transport system ATPase subunit